MLTGTEKGYDFDDLLLVPKNSTIKSRNEVDVGVNLGKNIVLNLPIIASPMKGIISPELVIKIAKAGGMGIMHRFYDDLDNHNRYLLKIRDDTNGRFGMAMSLSQYKNNIKWSLDNLGPMIVCLDVANGYLDKVTKATVDIANVIYRGGYNTLLMAGNVVTYRGAKFLNDCGVDLVRVGIGSGTLCTTRNNTGVGYPQLSAIYDCSGYYTTNGHVDWTTNEWVRGKRKNKNTGWKVIADGGIRNSGDTVKALAIGADAVMIGTLFAKCYESANNGLVYGMASRKLQEEYYHSVKSVEGIEKKLQPNIYFDDFIEEFTFNIKSACTYLDAFNLKELRENAKWVEVGRGSIK